MIDEGYKSPFTIRSPMIPASWEDDQEPTYEYKNRLSDDDDIWEWEKCEDLEDDIWVEYGDGWYSEEAFKNPEANADFPDDYHKKWRDDDDDDFTSESISSDDCKELFGIFLVILIIIMVILW
jgi:hypothetical protein